MGKLKDLTGQRFGRLVVKKFAGYKKTNSGNNKSIWTCDCDCGNEKDIAGGDLTSGRTKSCGCYQRENLENLKNINRTRDYHIGKVKQNRYDLSGEYGVGYTEKNDEFYFDLEDYDKIKDYYWNTNKDGYIASFSNKKCTLLHRLVMNINDPSIPIDHIKHNIKDNRKSELRIVTNSQNNINREIRSDNTSGVTGVCWYKKRDMWMSYISKDGKRKTIGYFINFDDAVKARKEAEEKYFGEYSYTNSINS